MVDEGMGTYGNKMQFIDRLQKNTWNGKFEPMNYFKGDVELNSRYIAYFKDFETKYYLSVNMKIPTNYPLYTVIDVPEISKERVNNIINASDKEYIRMMETVFKDLIRKKLRENYDIM